MQVRVEKCLSGWTQGNKDLKPLAGAVTGSQQQVHGYRFRISESIFIILLMRCVEIITVQLSGLSLFLPCCDLICDCICSLSLLHQPHSHRLSIWQSVKCPCASEAGVLRPEHGSLWKVWQVDSICDVITGTFHTQNNWKLQLLVWNILSSPEKSSREISESEDSVILFLSVFLKL